MSCIQRWETMAIHTHDSLSESHHLSLSLPRILFYTVFCSFSHSFRPPILHSSIPSIPLRRTSNIFINLTLAAPPTDFKNTQPVRLFTSAVDSTLANIISSRDIRHPRPLDQPRSSSAPACIASTTLRHVWRMGCSRGLSRSRTRLPISLRSPDRTIAQ